MFHEHRGAAIESTNMNRLFSAALNFDSLKWSLGNPLEVKFLKDDMPTSV